MEVQRGRKEKRKKKRKQGRATLLWFEPFASERQVMGK